MFVYKGMSMCITVAFSKHTSAPLCHYDSCLHMYNCMSMCITIAFSKHTSAPLCNKGSCLYITVCLKHTSALLYYKYLHVSIIITLSEHTSAPLSVIVDPVILPSMPSGPTLERLFLGALYNLLH